VSCGRLGYSFIRCKKQNAKKEQTWLICLYITVCFDAVCLYSTIPGYAGAAAQAAIVQPGQTAFVAAAHTPTYETYQTSQTAAPQYAFATRSQV